MIVDSAATAAAPLETAARLSRRFGEDPEYARAGGGNSSVKDDRTLFIKPSGVALASITPRSLMPLALAPLLALLEAGDEVAPGSDPVMRVAMAARLRDEGSLRPSVECVFHALIPRRYVIHTHPTTVNALTCTGDGEAIAHELFGDEVLWVPYTDPGLPLAREIAHQLEARGARGDEVDVMLLQNHGLIVAGDDETAIVEASEAVVRAVRARIVAQSLGGGEAVVSSPPDPARVEVLSRAIGARLGSPGDRAGGDRAVAVDASPDALWAAGTGDGRTFVESGPLTPDQIVYAGSWPLWLETGIAGGPDETLRPAIDRAVSEHVARRGEVPVVVVVEGIGVVATGAGPRQASVALQLYLDAIRVGRGALALGGVHPMPAEGRLFIERWEAEAYRRSLDAR